MLSREYIYEASDADTYIFAMEFFKLDQESEEKTVKVSKEVVENLWKRCTRNTTLAACISVFKSRILGPGFRYVNLEGKVSDEAFERHVRTYFVPFAEKALESLLVQGYCVYGVKTRNEKNFFPVPYVISRDSYEINVVKAKVEEKMNVVKTEDNTRKKFHLFVLSMPTSEGLPNSRVANVSHVVSYLEEIENHDIQAFVIRSKPPVLTKTQTDNSFDSRDVISGAVPGLRAQDESDNMEIRNKITIQQFKQQQDLITTLNKERIDSSKTFWMNHLDPSKNTLLSKTLKRESEGFVPKFVPLPNDVDVAKYELPPERRDFVDIKNNCKSQICVGMGIPETSIDGKFEGASNGLASRMTEEFIRVSIMPLKNALSNLLLELYENSIGDASNIDCNFPGLQNIDRLFFWYQNGILKREALVRSLCDLEQMRPSDFVNEGFVDPQIVGSPQKKIKLNQPSDKILRS